MPYDTISFFYPVRSVGGAQYLFARMAEHLIKHTSYEVVLIDYIDGFIRSKLGNRKYYFIEYKDEIVTSVQESFLLVLPLSFVPLIEQYFILPKTTRIFFWDLHPYNLVEQFALSGFYKRMSTRSARFFAQLLEYRLHQTLTAFVERGLVTHGIAFMAERNYTFNQGLLGFNGISQYLPLPIDTTALTPVYVKQKTLGDNIHLAWISRLSREKIPSLLRLIADVKAFDQLEEAKTLKIHIIGEGPDIDRIRVHCEGVKVYFPGQLEGIALTDYLNDYIDVGFAMGTSVLEFAARGLPSVLVSAGLPQDNLQSDHVYRWLFDSDGYNITAEETSISPTLRSLSEIINDYQTTELLNIFGERSRSYAITNHRIEAVSVKFVDNLDRCTFTYQDLVDLGINRPSLYGSILLELKQMTKRVIGR